MDRRKFLKSASLLSIALAGSCTKKLSFNANENSNNKIIEIDDKLTDNLYLSDSFNYQRILSYGDSLYQKENFVLENKTNLQNSSGAFGYNNDFNAFFPINGSSTHGILCTNHESATAKLMFNDSKLDKNKSEIILSSLGVSIIEIKKKSEWQINYKSPYNRRINGLNSKCLISGPLSGHPKLQTSYDTKGLYVYGTLANCAGGKTPWHTLLTAEENFDDFFAQNKQKANYENYKKYGIEQKSRFGLEKFVNSFDLRKEPNQANKFGYIVEIDPKNPQSLPKKRTALGRFKHEVAHLELNYDNRVAVYMSDDEGHQYIYKYVSDETYDETTGFNSSILDKGTLYVAKFFETGSLKWLPLKYGENGLDSKNGFKSQADICLETRKAADIVGATPMDRPEGISSNPKTGEIFVALTKNNKRLIKDFVNKEAPNKEGYILKITTAGKLNHSSQYAKYEIFLYGSETSKPNKFANPDNIIFDKKGNMLVATDGLESSNNISEGLFYIKGKTPIKLLGAPIGAEVTGPEFTPDNKTLFVSIQHPGSGSTYNAPSTRWPYFNPNYPPLPSVIAIERRDKKTII